VRLGHAIALVGALALMLVMAMDWYGTVKGDEFREAQRNSAGSPRLADANEEAKNAAEAQEKNAWQADHLIDWVLLVLMLAAILLAVLAAIARAAGAKPTPGLGPSGLAALSAAGAAIAVAYRIIQEPGDDAVTTVKAGGLLALIALAMIALGSAYALRADDKEVEAADAGAA
jgi:hypothetical protein